MQRVLSSSLVALALTASQSLAAIGPVTDLNIFNAVVAPDGFSRDAVTAEGGAIGPLISGNKVHLVLNHYKSCPNLSLKGDQFQINVVNTLNDSTMLQSTSIVRQSSRVVGLTKILY